MLAIIYQVIVYRCVLPIGRQRRNIGFVFKGCMVFPVQPLNYTFSDKRKKTTHFCVIFIVACLEGFEPPTYWFVASHSIQLSYKHISLTTILIIAHPMANVNTFFENQRFKQKLLYYVIGYEIFIKFQF